MALSAALQQVLADAVARQPLLVELATYASLAARIEAPLLRRLRQQLLPEAEPGIEADLWFSPLVESFDADACVLHPWVAEQLRAELLTSGRLGAVWAIVGEAHAAAPPWQRLEEEVAYLSLTGAGAQAAEALRGALKAMVDSPERGVQVARWAMHALPRLPQQAAQWPEARALEQGMHARIALIGAAPRWADTPLFDHARDGWVLPAAGPARPSIAIGLRVDGDALLVCDPAQVAADSRLQIPESRTCRLQVRTIDATGRVRFAALRGRPGQRVVFEAPPRDIEITTEAGAVFGFEPVVHLESMPENDPPVDDARRRPRGGRRYRDCQYSLFVSYAHADDTSHFGWVQALRSVFSQRLERLDGSIPKLGLFMGQDNGPSGGTLASELQDRLESSFGMLLVVGERYARSAWCEAELKTFFDLFGATGLRQRLYIAVMSEGALNVAQRGEQWQRLMPADQVWVPMFQELDRNRPLEHLKGDGSPGYGREFVERAARMADHLVAEIERDEAESRSRKSASGELTRERRRRIAIGPHTVSLAGSVQAIKLALENAGAEVTVLGRDAIDDYDPDDGRPLRPLLATADVLVVPATLEPPLAPSIDGGHTTILKREWAAAGKAERDLVWYRPAEVVISPGGMAKERHQKVFGELAPVCFNEAALVSHLFGIGSTPAIRIHIENHPQEHAFEPLARQLEAAWNALLPDRLRPKLHCVSLDLDDLANASKDVAGVVLLMPVPLKDQRQLQAQIDQVERLIPKTGTYPGCVVVIHDSLLSRQPSGYAWCQVVAIKSETEPRLTIENDSKADLDGFLLDIWERYRRSTRKMSSP